MIFDTPEKGDLFFFRKDSKIDHTGLVIYTSNNLIGIIDAVEWGPKRKINKVVARVFAMDETYWVSRIDSYGRVIPH